MGRREFPNIVSLHCAENPIYVFFEMKLRGLVPNSYIHESVCDLYIPRIGLPIWLQPFRQTDPKNLYIIYRYMNVEILRQNFLLCRSFYSRSFSFLGIHKSEPDIYIGFSPALYLQCVSNEAAR
jgi:hypothetical protein